MDKDSKKRPFTEIDPHHSILKGWGEIKQKDVKVAKKELMAALSIKAGATFYRRLRGQIVPTVEEYQAIIKVFKKYGVKQPFGI